MGVCVKYMVEFHFKSCDDDLNESLRLHYVYDSQMVKHIQLCCFFSRNYFQLFRKVMVT